MMTKSVTIDIDLETEDLEEFYTEDLLSELESRGNKKDIKLIRSFCEQFLYDEFSLSCKSLEDELKLNILADSIKKYSLTELEERLK